MIQTRIALVAAPLALLLGGCPAPSPIYSLPKAPDGETARIEASGSNPAWTLAMDRDRYTFTSDVLGVRRSGEWSAGQRIEGGIWRHAMDGLTVDFLPDHCMDAATATRYYSSYRVIVDGRELSGCGGIELPPENLAGTSWTGQRWIGQHQQQRNFAGSMQFAAGRITGNTGCNRFSADYSVDGRFLTVGPLAMTKMACKGDTAKNEAAMAEMFSGRSLISFTPDGTLTLFSPYKTLTFKPAE